MATKTKSGPQHLLPIITEPKILVFKEKHGDRYFLVSDDDVLYDTALKVLTERFKAGYWYFKPDELGAAPDFTAAQVAAMPKSLRAGALKRLREYTEDLRYYNRGVQAYAAIVKAVETKDGRLAWQALTDRQDGEYEGFRLERLESVLNAWRVSGNRHDN